MPYLQDKKDQLEFRKSKMSEKRKNGSVVSLHEYKGLLKNNSKYSQKYLAKKTTVLKYNAFSSFAVVA